MSILLPRIEQQITVQAARLLKPAVKNAVAENLVTSAAANAKNRAGIGINYANPPELGHRVIWRALDLVV